MKKRFEVSDIVKSVKKVAQVTISPENVRIIDDDCRQNVVIYHNELSTRLADYCDTGLCKLVSINKTDIGTYFYCFYIDISFVKNIEIA